MVSVNFNQTDRLALFVMVPHRSLVNHGFDPLYHFLHFETAPNAKINGLGAALACASIDQVDRVPLFFAVVQKSQSSHILECVAMFIVYCREFYAAELPKTP